MSAAAVVHPELAAASFEGAIQPLLDDPEKYGKFGVRLVGYSFPYLDIDLEWRTQGRVIRLRVDGTDFPYRPIGGWWIDANGERLTTGTQQVPSGQGFHVQNQKSEPECWFCWLGWRAYHDFSGHQDTSWASIRRNEHYALLRLVLRLNDDLNRTGVMAT